MVVEVESANKESVAFNEIRFGECFRHEGVSYLKVKTDNVETYSAVTLSNGYLSLNFRPSTKVTPLKAKVIVEG